MVFQNIEKRDAIVGFETDFSELATDPRLRSLVGAQADRDYAEALYRNQTTGEAPPSYSTTLQGAAKTISDWLPKGAEPMAAGASNPQPNSQPSVSVDPDRSERKRVSQPPAPRSRQTATTAPSVAPEEKDELTGRRDAIAKIAENRRGAPIQ